MPPEGKPTVKSSSMTKSTQFLMDYDAGKQFVLTMDDEKLTIELMGAAAKRDFKQTYKTLAAMEKDYKARVVPYLKECEAYDIDREEEAEIATSLKAFFEELRAVGGDSHEDESDGDLETLVDNATKMFRKQLNRAIGDKKTSLDVAVFLFEEGMPSLWGVAVNPTKVKSTMTDAQLEKGLKDVDNQRKAALDLEMNPIGGDALKPYGDPYNLYDWCSQQLMELALARLEAKPGLRANATVKAGCRFLLDEPNWALMRRAREHGTKPAKAFFDATRDLWKTPEPKPAAPKKKTKR
jgi:hypothetical protein